MTSVFRARGVSVSFGGVRAVAGVDLEIEAGELVGFDGYTNVAAWLERGLARPAVQRGLDIPKRP